MFANRLSWTFDFRGPSKAIDTGDPLLNFCMHKAALSDTFSAPNSQFFKTFFLDAALIVFKYACVHVLGPWQSVAKILQTLKI